MKDLIIIGSGPAGLTAAIYAKRAELDVSIIEKSSPGGQLVNISTIDNYPGTPGILGPDLAYSIYSQVNSLKVPFIFDEVLEVIKNDDNTFLVVTTKNKYQAKSVLIASGNSPRKLNLENEERYFGKGISYCAICDGPLYKDEDIVIIGGGNSAIEEAIYLSSIVKHITILQNLDHLTASKSLIERLNGISNIDIKYSSVALELSADSNGINGLKYLQEEKENYISTKAIFVYIGLIPNASFVKNLGVLNEYGYVVTDDNLKTSVDGLYAAGDIAFKHIRQIVTATSDGAVAVTEILKYLGRF